jgi:hypothetical protein
VKVTKVFAKTLAIPALEYRDEHNKRRRACLGDFVLSEEDESFELLLPYTMLRQHNASDDVRNYGGNSDIDLIASARRRSRPSRPSSAALARRLVEEINDVEEETADLFVDLISGDAGTEDAEESDSRLDRDLDAIRLAEIRSDRAEFERNFESLHCDELGPVPTVVKNKFSCVLGDIFHAIDRVKVHTRHEWKKAYKHSLMKAFLEWDPSCLDEVKKILMEKGWTKKEFESTLYYKPSFFRRRVPRVALPPSQLYYRVRAVFVTFGNRVDSKTKVPLFNAKAWNKAKNLLEEILEGYYSDPPGVDWYFCELDEKKNIKVDQYGIQLLRSGRGTNLVESVHRQYNTTFRHRSGIEMGDALLAERRHRHNIDVARRNYRDYPEVGHYDTWMVDLLQELVEYNTGKILYPGWQGVCDYEDTDEGFVVTPLHATELEEALKKRVACLQEERNFRMSFSPDVQFLCRSWGVPIPFLPVAKKEEFKLFSDLLLSRLEKFDAEKMAALWIEYVDGKTIFPKLPVQLKNYHREWERNRRIGAQQRRAAPDLQLFNKFLGTMSSGAGEGSVATVQLPPSMPQPIAETARRDSSAGVVRVDNINMGIHADGESEFDRVERKRGRPKGLGDNTGRKIRSCRSCAESGIQERIAGAAACPGKTYRKRCKYAQTGEEETTC